MSEVIGRKQLGGGGLEVSPLAFGLMSLSSTYGKSDDAESIATIHHAIDLGINFLDTAEAYGGGHNERLAAQVLRERRSEVVLATKFGIYFSDRGMEVNGRPENVHRAIEGSLDRLGVDHVDLYYLHRRDPDVPIEETVGAMAGLVEAGKVRHLGLSAVSVETLQRACAVHPITALQSEYSLWTRDPEAGVLAACKSLGVSFVAYSPLGRGFLTGTIRRREDLEEGDYRRISPRFEEGNFERNLELADLLREMSAEKGIEAAQLALAWLFHRDEHVIPLFGTRRAARVESNLQAVKISLDASDLQRLEKIAPPGIAAGEGLPDFLQRFQER